MQLEEQEFVAVGTVGATRSDCCTMLPSFLASILVGPGCPGGVRFSAFSADCRWSSSAFSCVSALGSSYT